MTQLVRVF